MNARQKNMLFFLCISLLLLTIIGYNYWSYRCGYCTITSLLSFSAPALLLLSGIGVTILFLFAIKTRNKRRLFRRRCRCGTYMRTQWIYCPTCGQLRKI